MDTKSLTAEIDIKGLTAEIEKQMIEIRRNLHEKPELSLQEFRTTKLIFDTLKDTNIELTKCSNDTGIIGLLKGTGEGPTLAIRADIDALPIIEETGLDFTSGNLGVMHACGHDIHTSVLLGTAIVLDKVRDRFKGQIKFIFQPAEEIMQGAKLMIEEGVLSEPKVDHIVCLHTWPFTDAGKISVKHDAIMASTNRFEIEVFGTGGHAAHPHRSVDPIPVAAQIVTGLQQIVSRILAPLDPAVVTIGQIHGGTADNIIANKVTISGTVRTLKTETSDKIKESIEEISENIAKAFNGNAIVKYYPGSPPVINDEKLVDLLAEAVKESLGKEALEYLPEPSLGGEDFSFYLQHVGGMLFRLGTRNETEASQKGLHNPGIIFDEKSIPTGIIAMSSFAIKYLNQ
ncbi:M20 metallopeptidase family protein [Cytobacillus oceanisediminis]|uniref:M20 metallopeptidase family protein n=1 Tax=Cytobacillus oceanisediminis TaxID=665099 RepID=UPI003734D4A3